MTLLRASALPEETGDILLAATANNTLYMMDTSDKYPAWVLLPSPLRGTPIIDSQIIVDSLRKLLFIVFTDSKMYVSGPDTVLIDGWTRDTSLNPFASTLKAFALDDNFGDDTNESTWGYLIACAKGLKSCSGGTFSSGQITSMACRAFSSFLTIF